MPIALWVALIAAFAGILGAGIALAGNVTAQMLQGRREQRQQNLIAAKERRAQLEPLLLPVVRAVRVCREYVQSDPDNDAQDEYYRINPQLKNDYTRAKEELDSAIDVLTLKSGVEEVLAVVKRVRSLIGRIESIWDAGTPTNVWLQEMDQLDTAYHELVDAAKRSLEPPTALKVTAHTAAPALPAHTAAPTLPAHTASSKINVNGGQAEAENDRIEG
jgi:hypothetical protein